MSAAVRVTARPVRIRSVKATPRGRTARTPSPTRLPGTPPLTVPRRSTDGEGVTRRALDAPGRCTPGARQGCVKAARTSVAWRSRVRRVTASWSRRCSHTGASCSIGVGQRPKVGIDDVDPQRARRGTHRDGVTGSLCDFVASARVGHAQPRCVPGCLVGRRQDPPPRPGARLDRTAGHDRHGVVGGADRRRVVVDGIDSRLEMARPQNADPIDFGTEDPVQTVLESNGGIGVDRIIDAVGVDAYRHKAGPDGDTWVPGAAVGHPRAPRRSAAQASSACTPPIFDRFPLGGTPAR
ncbi:hypothetical protein L618_002800000140 [Rhodococcus rhodochrous J45]|uniref:Uncharacterized protein n=1 Tax=Rhodococcus rhodochrous J45 TaxID=935266 RepID=A0A562E2Y0_RHORH|nr:hypothetical protein L618_002800000140 [Rhodococcus rhodochrous J45]